MIEFDQTAKYLRCSTCNETGKCCHGARCNCEAALVAVRRSSSVSDANARVMAGGRAIRTKSSCALLNCDITASAAERKRRLARLRITALPILRLTVKPTRDPVSRWSELLMAACNRNAGAPIRTPFAAMRKKSDRSGRRPQALPMARLPGERGLGRQALTALGATGGQDLAAANGCHAGPEAMAAFTHQLARLIRAFHGKNSGESIG